MIIGSLSESLEDYLEMIAVNMNKRQHKAVKTLVSFV